MRNPPAGIKIQKVLHTLGQYDIVILCEAPNEKAALIAAMNFGEKASTETMVAIPHEEAKDMMKQKP